MAYQKKNKLHIVAVTAVIINKQGQVLIAKRSAREIAFPGRWALPGGKIEDNNSVMQTLKDECHEEVGLEIEDRKIYLEDSAFVRPDNQTVKVFSYLVFAKALDVKLNENDFSEFRWVDVNEVGKYNCVGMNKNKLLRALEYLKKDNFC
jgi:mutator protein MutT